MINEVILGLIALIPFLLLLFFLIILRMPAIKAMPLTWLATFFIVYFLWKLEIVLIVVSFIKGFLITIEIMLIIFCAIFLIELLKEKSHMRKITGFLSSLSKDIRIQVLIIAFLFGALIEGVAGFGMPAAIVAPLLVSLGFAPFLAIIVSLISNSTPVSFGAAGLPILLGIGSLEGFGITRSVIEEIAKQVALFHLIGSIIIPVALCFLVISSVKSLSKKEKRKAFFEIMPFALLAWLGFIVPYFLIAWFIGPELPSIVGGLISLIFIGFIVSEGFFVPKNILTFQGFVKSAHKKFKISLKNMFSLLPYFIIVFFLLLTRAIPLLSNLVKSVKINWLEIFGTNINFEFLPLFTPSFYLLLTSFICIIIYKINKKEIRNSLNNALHRIKYPLISLIFALALVQLIINSGQNAYSIESIPLLLAGLIASILGKFYVFISPFIGSFGAFIAGSNTVSNLLFGALQAETAQALGFSLIIILSLQVVGGAIGNMIAIHNILAVSATVGLKGQEGKIIKKTIVVMLIYGVIVAITGALFIFLI